MSERAFIRGALALAASALLAGCYESRDLGGDAGAGRCRFTCVADSDCGSPTRCSAEGLCEPLPACTSDADCAASEACRLSGSRDVPTCLPRCTTDHDCAAIGPWGERRCVSGACAWVGCTTDEWCASFLRGTYRNPMLRARCEPSPDTAATCRWLCEADADCTTEAYAPMRCQSGYCVDVGCTTDAQCDAWWGSVGPTRCVRR